MTAPGRDPAAAEMRVVEEPRELQRLAVSVRMSGRSIGLVPTMGALHEGHLSLIRRARSTDDFVIVSIFVNPAQFGPNEDLDRYPRALERDLEACRSCGVDAVFVPTASALYPEGFQTYVEVGPLAARLCGASRPGHFRGVATICLKLFNLSQPARAYFGLKDYQQYRVVERMVRDFDLPLELVPMPIVREPDGLAMSSRNSYLSPAERSAATVIFRSLEEARRACREGERDPRQLAALVRGAIEKEPLARVDYVEAVDPLTLEPAVGLPVLVAAAVFIGGTRLIDNVLLEEPETAAP